MREGEGVPHSFEHTVGLRPMCLALQEQHPIWWPSIGQVHLSASEDSCPKGVDIAVTDVTATTIMWPLCPGGGETLSALIRFASTNTLVPYRQVSIR